MSADTFTNDGLREAAQHGGDSALPSWSSAAGSGWSG
jgi:hypothetical protein